MQVPVIRSPGDINRHQHVLLCIITVSQTHADDVINCLTSVTFVQKIVWNNIRRFRWVGCGCWDLLSIDCFDFVLSAVDRVVSGTVSQLFPCGLMTYVQNCQPALSLWFDDLRLELIKTNFECVIRPEMTLCGCYDVQIQELHKWIQPTSVVDWAQSTNKQTNLNGR